MNQTGSFKSAILLGLAMSLIGCAPVTQAIAPVRVKTTFSMIDFAEQVPVKPLNESRWLNADRVVVFSEITGTYQMVKPSKNPAREILGHLGAIGAVVVWDIMESRTEKPSFESVSKKKDIDIQERMRSRLENAMKERFPSVVAVTGKLNDHPETVLSVTDTVVQASIALFFLGEQDKVQMEAILAWEVSCNGLRYRRLVEGAGSGHPTGSRKTAAEWENDHRERLKHLDGFGQFFYKCSSHPKAIGKG